MACKFLQVIYIRPLPDSILDEIKKAKKVILVENNATGQLAELISKKTGIQIKNKILKYEISANRFLHGMVRTLVGTMVNVGRGHTKYEEFHTILESNNRSFAGMSAPAKGLCLEEIMY